MNYDKFKQFELQALNTVYREEVGGFHDELIPQIAQRFLPEFKIKKSACILDIGCGPGIFMQAAKDLGYKNTIGITLSKEDVDMCLDSGHKAVLASMTDLPYKDSSVDFIWCRHALEHSPYPLFTLFEFHRVLCTGGQAFIEIPAPNNERAYMHEFNPNHYSILGDRMWIALFGKAKFECWAMWNYDINLPFENGTVNEKSYMFAVKKL
jgi:SAM-dependent methyltransferase